MIKKTLPAIFVVLCFFSGFQFGIIANAVASPVMQDRDELEKMILKKIEEGRKKKEAEQAKNGGAKTTPKVSQPAASRKFDAARVPDSSSDRVIPPRVKPVPKEPVYGEPTEMKSADKEFDESATVKFSFADEEWKDVIEWFADQVGFGVYYGQSEPPQGTFTYIDDTERNVLEALNFLNSRLAVLNPSYVLVRNGNQLVLVNESGNYPDFLIRPVTEDELEQLGTFEVVKCTFDLGRLAGDIISQQIQSIVSDVHLDGFSYIPAANHLEVRERVYELQRIRDLINFAKQAETRVAVDIYECQHVEPEALLINLRPLMGFAPETNALEDGSLSFSVQTLGNKIYLKGNPDRLDEFKDTAALIDTEFDDGDQLIEKPFLKVYPVSGDPEVIFQVIQTLLEGEPNVKLDQDSVNKNLYVWATKPQHDRVAASLDTMSGDVSFAIVPVRNISATDAVSKVEELLGITSFGAEEQTGPRLVADTESDSVYVNGSPREIQLVKRMIEDIDANVTSFDGPRRPMRLIPTSQRQAESIMNHLQIPGILDSIGRRNRLQLIMPKDRKNFRDNLINPNFNGRNRSGDRQNRDSMEDGAPTPSPLTTTMTLAPRSSYYARTVAQDEESITSQSVRTPTDTGENDGYQPAEEQPSVPGAPIEVRMTDQGIVVYSEDLDAADDIELMIKDLIDMEGQADLPSFFYLEFRKVEEVKGILDGILGLSSSSGGGAGGGGIAGLLGGAVSNAVGGAAGDALSGLLGGGDGGGDDATGSGIELEGEEVKLTTDVRSNMLIVIGATSNDLDLIAELLDILDVDSPPQDPNLSGETHVIPIKYRDAMYVKERVLEQLSDYFASSNSNENRNQGNLEQQIQRQVLQQIAGGNRRGRGGSSGNSNSSGEQPKARLGVDEVTNSLLVTGPRFIYFKVADLVAKIDRKKEQSVALYRDVAPDALIRLLKVAFGEDMIVTPEDSAEGGDSPSSAGNSRSSSGSSGGNRTGFNRGSSRGGASTDRGAVERAIQNAIRNRGGGSAFQIPQGGGNSGGGRGGGGRGGR